MEAMLVANEKPAMPADRHEKRNKRGGPCRLTRYRGRPRGAMMCRLAGRVSGCFFGEDLEAGKPHSIGSERLGSHPKGERSWESVGQWTRRRIAGTWPD